jgi:hypothetical protein
MQKFILIFFLVFFLACAEKENSSTKVKTTENNGVKNNGVENKNVEEKVEKINYTPETFAMGEVALLAKNITYPVIIKNPDKADEWTDECLQELDIQVLAKLFFDLIYSGKVKAFPYMSDQEMSIEEVKTFEKEHSRKRIAKVLFEEEWFFDQNNARMYKKIKSIMLAYELYYETGEVKGYKAGIQIFLNH